MNNLGRNFSIIVSMDEQRGIGKNNQLPWRISEDMKHFKSTTLGHYVIMGRKTWDSLPLKFRPLENRINIIISHVKLSEVVTSSQVFPVNSLEEALQICMDSQKKIFIIGGASIYALALQHPNCFELIISEIPGKHECDTFFPEILSKWEKTNQLFATEKFTVNIYHRKKQEK